MISKIINTGDSSTTILIRLMVGGVFLSEGIQKFLFPELLGSGMFQQIGLPIPEFLGGFVGAFEILCGIMFLLGLFTRLAAIPTIIIMLVALCTTKAEVFVINGVWSFLHASRTDWAMLMGSIFLLIEGGGRWSVDKK